MSGKREVTGRTVSNQLLSAAEERDLARRVQQGDQGARAKLAERNIRLVYSVARRYSCRSHTLEDLVQEGSIGLLMAIDRFDPDKGFRLATYATHWIRQAVTRAVERQDRMIRVPVSAHGDLNAVRDARDNLLENDKEVTADNIAYLTDFSVKRVEELLLVLDDAGSLDVHLSEGEGDTLLDMVENDSAVDPEAAMIEVAEREAVRAALAKLEPREQKVLMHRHGFETGERVTLHVIAMEMGLSREGVRSIQKRAQGRVRELLAEPA